MPAVFDEGHDSRIHGIAMAKPFFLYTTSNKFQLRAGLCNSINLKMYNYRNPRHFLSPVQHIYKRYGFHRKLWTWTILQPLDEEAIATPPFPITTNKKYPPNLTFMKEQTKYQPQTVDTRVGKLGWVNLPYDETSPFSIKEKNSQIWPWRKQWPSSGLSFHILLTRLRRPLLVFIGVVTQSLWSKINH